MALTVS